MSAQQGGSSWEELSSERAHAAVLARAPGKKSAAAVGAALARARRVPEADRCADLSDFLWHCERPEVLAAQHGVEAEHAADWSLDRRLGLALQLADVDWYRATLRVSKEFTSRAAEDLAFAPMGWFPGWPWDLSAYSAVDAALISICIGRLLFELARTACAGGPTEEEDLEAIRCTSRFINFVSEPPREQELERRLAELDTGRTLAELLWSAHAMRGEAMAFLFLLKRSSPELHTLLSQFPIPGGAQGLDAAKVIATFDAKIMVRLRPEAAVAHAAATQVLFVCDELPWATLRRTLDLCREQGRPITEMTLLVIVVRNQPRPLPPAQLAELLGDYARCLREVKPWLPNTVVAEHAAFVDGMTGKGPINIFGKYYGVVCDACQGPPGHLQLCSSCRSARYCSPECQRRAWPAHKAECRRLAAARGGATK